jgi:glyoxylase-like metal-dependent hydrolase (beta-lactamase superfamily II)
MTIHLLNTFTCGARFYKDWNTGLLSFLVETEQGLVLIDTGLGTAEYKKPSWFTQVFRVVTRMPFDPREAAVTQLERLGYQAEDIKHIVLTHMHFDHISGITDFPHAKVHVFQDEYDAFIGKRQHFFELAYDKNCLARDPNFELYKSAGEKWFDFDAIRLPFSPEMWLVPLTGHSRGHCGIAIQKEDGWYLHCADAAGDFRKEFPAWAIRFFLGEHEPRLRAFGDSHPEVELTASHMFLDFFDKN